MVGGADGAWVEAQGIGPVIMKVDESYGSFSFSVAKKLFLKQIIWKQAEGVFMFSVSLRLELGNIQESYLRVCLRFGLGGAIPQGCRFGAKGWSRYLYFSVLSLFVCPDH